ncbi:MAG: hypothetical protein AAFZ15_14230 [Bacteroidota bacterium]
MAPQIFSLILTFSFLFLQSITFSQSTAHEKSRDYVYFKHGGFIKGTITKNMDKHGIGVRSELGAELFYDFCEIRRIIRKPPLLQLLDSSYTELGLTYGLPGILNFNIGHWFGRTGVRVSGMYYGEDFAGIQLHVGYKLSDNNRQRHSVGFSYGRMGSLANEGGGLGYAGLVYNYTGPALAIKRRHHAFFAEIGYGRYFETGNEGADGVASFGPILQVGFLHRFVPHAPRTEHIPIPRCPKPPKKKKQKRPKIKKVIVREKNVIVRSKVKNIIVRPKIVDPEKVPDPPTCPDCPATKPCPDCPKCPATVSPDSIENPVEVSVKESNILLRIRDNGIPDGDIISLELNGEIILLEHTLTKKEKEIPIILNPEKENLLVVIAHNMGKRSPNTSVISIYDGIKNKKVILNATMEKPQALQFILNK